MSDLPGAPAVLPPGGERRAAVRGVAWGGVEAATGALVGFLLTPLVVRAAGIEGLGLWAASWSLAHTAGLLDLGVSASYARFTARAIATGDTRALNGTVGAGVGFHLALSSLVAIGALAGAPLALARLTPPGAPRGEVVVVLFATLAVVLLRLTLSAYRGVVAGAQRIDLLGRIGAAVALLEGCGAAAALALGFGLRGMALNSLASAMLACLAEGIIAHAVCPGLRLRPFAARRSDWREILTFGLNLQASRAAEILAAHVPRLALALGPGLAQAGAYDLAARVASALNVAGALPLPVVQPLASRLEARGDRIRLRALLARASRYVALLVLPGAGLILLDPGTLLLAWTGRAAPAGATAAARLLALAVTLSLLASPIRLVLRGLGRPGIEAGAATGAACLSLALAPALASPYGPAGVAAASLLGSLVSALLLVRGARAHESDLVRGAARDWLSGPLGAAFAASLTGLALRLAARGWQEGPGRAAALLRLAPEAALLFGVFVLVAFLAGGLRREDLALWREAAPLAGVTGGRA